MDTNTFCTYSLNVRIELLNRKGEYISRISFYGHIVNLYICDRLYVEVYSNRYNNRIEVIELLDPKEKRLNQYAAQVNISEGAQAIK